MKSDNKNISETTKKILKGLDLVSEKLIEKAKKEKRELVVLEGDQIKKIRFSK